MTGAALVRWMLATSPLVSWATPMSERSPATQPPMTARSALSEPSLSPDGKEVAFIAGGDIWTVPASGGVARLLVAHPATESRPLWSPDGTRIAFVSTRTGGGDLYVLELATGRLTRRTFDDGREQLDNWSRDGAWLYYSTSSSDISGMNDVWRVNANGGQPALVLGDRYATEYWSAPSPDGKTLAITARGTVSGQWWRHGHSHLDESEVWLVRGLDTPTPVYELFGQGGGAKEAWPMWAADGNVVYFVSDRSGQENLWAKPMASDIANNTGRQITNFRDGRVLWPSMAYDGSTIVFERNYGLWRYDVAKGTASEIAVTLRGASADVASEKQTLTQGFGALGVSPDGRKAVFVARGDVFVVGTRDGGEATRLTATPDLESEPSWFPDSRRVVYAALRGTAWNLFVQDAVTRETRAITTGTGRNYGARVSPDGKWVAYQRDGGEIRVVAADGTNDRRVAQAVVDEPPFGSAAALTWSPDSKRIAYAADDTGRWSNLWVVGLDGAAPQRVTFGADANVGGVVWSGDGKFLLYRTAQRTETPRIMRVDLVPRTPRFREDQFRDLFGPLPGTTPPAPAPTPAVTVRDTAARTTPPVTPAPASTAPVTIDFTGIRLRASLVPTQGLVVGALTLSPDSRTLAFTATAGGQQQIYTLSLDELARDQQLRTLTTSPGGKSALQFSADSRDLWYLEGGRISAITVESRVARTVAASADVDIAFEAEKRAIFDQARSYLANNFFDATMHGVDWSGLAARVEPYAMGSRNPDDLRRVMSLMIGELNGSHLGVSGPTTGGVTVPMARLGVQFDRVALEQRGQYRVSEVIAQGPAAVAGVTVGDVFTVVDGVTLGRAMSLDSALVGKVGRKLTVSATTASGAAKSYALATVSLATEKALRYRQWVEQQRAYVARISDGRLGYVHMFDMGEPSLDQLYLDLDAENQARDGVVVDVRNNNGGFVNPYAIDVLARRSYLQFTSRGSVPSPARGNLGQRTLERPTVLVTNQHTLSDGEDFTEGYRSLKLGKVVGEPTAGWIIFTSNVPLLDGSTLRLPSTRVTDAQGRDMELSPRPVDISVLRPLGESYSGRDRQLDAAARALLDALPKKP